jgi:hypothetical protein
MDSNRSAEAVAAAEQMEDRVAKLDATILRSMARRRDAAIEMGRAFTELKTILGHGKWQRHFAETFVPCGINLRTAERYMKRALEADAISKNDSVSTFKQANDRGAQAMREANQHARAEVDASLGNNKVKKETLRLYRLPLRMTGDEQDAMEALRKLPDWPRAEKKIVSLLKRLWVAYGVVNKDARRRS